MKSKNLLRQMIREELIKEFSIGSFFSSSSGKGAIAAAKMNLAAMQDSGSLNFEDAIEYIRTLEDAGEDAAAAYWHNQLKKHAGEEKPKSYRSKDNLQFQKRMDDIYGRRKNI